MEMLVVISYKGERGRNFMEQQEDYFKEEWEGKVMHGNIGTEIPCHEFELNVWS